ncbi:MAG: UbiD family decarboxylase [Chloroflexota bacterium]
MAYYKDLREHLQALEERGKLVRIDFPVNKDTQLHPLVRLQFRGLPEEQRKAFLFTNIFDSRGKKYNIPVAICALAGSSEIYGIGLMCRPEEITEKMTRAELHPIPPKLVKKAPVQEEVHVDEGLMEHGALDEFPVPISTPGYDPAPFLTASYWVTKDPDTGIRNVGVYRAHLKSPTRTGINYERDRDIYRHWEKCRAKGIPLEAAIVIGGPPSCCYAAVTRYPYGVDEFTMAGGIAGEALELVKCQTVDLEVPSHAEIVLEGELTTGEMEVEAPFGEAVGYLGMTEVRPYFTVKCITHRKNPILLAFLSQFPPSESSKIRQHGNESAVYKYLKHDLNIGSVLAVAFHESVCSNFFAVIQMKKPEQSEVWKALEGVGQRFGVAKLIIAVDEDINPWEPEAVNWALGLRMQPHRDLRVLKYQTSNLLDLSLENTEDLIQRRHATRLEKAEASRLLLNATRKWPYPPVSLPKKEFMEEALKLWKKAGLPDLKLKDPWWGYNLGYWAKEYDEEAERAVKGEYYQTGELRSKNRTKL